MARKDDTETINPDNEVKQEKDLDSPTPPESKDSESNLDTESNIKDSTDSTLIDSSNNNEQKELLDKEFESVDRISDDRNSFVENNELRESNDDKNEIDNESKEIKEDNEIQNE